MAGSKLPRPFSLFIKATSIILLIIPILGFSQEKLTKSTTSPSPRIQFTVLAAEAERTLSEGEFGEALELSSRAYSLAQKTGYDEGKLDSLIQQGFLYWNLGRMKESSEAFSRAVPISL